MDCHSTIFAIRFSGLVSLEAQDRRFAGDPKCRDRAAKSIPLLDPTTLDMIDWIYMVVQFATIDVDKE